MLDLKKLNNLLDAALESETPESLNRWIEEQMQADHTEEKISMKVRFPMTVQNPTSTFSIRYQK